MPYTDSHRHATDLVLKEESQRLIVCMEERKKYHYSPVNMVDLFQATLKKNHLVTALLSEDEKRLKIQLSAPSCVPSLFYAFVAKG